MRIKFGPTKIEKDRELRKWHWWFAWYPVRLTSGTAPNHRQGVWLEWVVCRRKDPDGSYYCSGLKYEYRPSGEVNLRSDLAFLRPRVLSSDAAA
jgi:hypothetical protein